MLIGRLADDTTCSLYRPKQIRVLFIFSSNACLLSAESTNVVVIRHNRRSLLRIFYLVRAIALPQIKSLRLRLKIPSTCVCSLSCS